MDGRLVMGCLVHHVIVYIGKCVFTLNKEAEKAEKLRTKPEEGCNKDTLHKGH